MIKQLNLRVGDKVSYGGKLCEVTRNPDNGYYDIQQVGASGWFSYSVTAYEIDLLYTRKCIECDVKDVMPEAKNGRCEECLEIQKERLAV